MIVIEGPVPFDGITMGQAEGDKQASKIPLQWLKIGVEMAVKCRKFRIFPHFRPTRGGGQFGFRQSIRPPSLAPSSTQQRPKIPFVHVQTRTVSNEQDIPNPQTATLTALQIGTIYSI